MENQDKEHMKDGLKMMKKVACDYKQKLVTKAGKCIPKVLNSHETITKPTSYEQQFDGEDYITFNLTDEIKDYFDL